MSLNLNPESTASKKSKSYKKALRVGGAVSLVGVGSTFAANITLNSDQNVEFGQGVAQTLSCDDQVSINPVSYYDNTSGTFRLDYVEVSGINLIPVGAISGTYDASASPQYQYADASAIAAHPGQYLDSENNNTWTNTCDQVVLDFKAFTDQTKYSTNTLDGYDSVYNHASATPNTISSPLLWSVDSEAGDGVVHGQYDWAFNPNFAVVFNGYENDTNKGALPVRDGITDNFQVQYPSSDGGTGYVKEASFKFFPFGGHFNLNNIGTSSNDPAAGAISKITVESMKYFPTDYNLEWSTNPGTYGLRP